VNSKIKVSDLREPEIKKKKREHAYKSGFVLKVEKAALLIQQSCRAFKASGGDKIKRPSLDFEYQKIENCEG
jgi:hypothetical protein